MCRDLAVNVVDIGLFVLLASYVVIVHGEGDVDRYEGW